MKTAITGHTSGIGQRLYDRLSPNAIGFSRGTGYDIDNKEDRRRIIRESKDCDVFINSAGSNFAQTYLLIELFNAWKDTNKTIINIGSRVAEIKLPASRLELLEYQAQKLILKNMVNELQGYPCNVTYKWFAYVGTERILKKYPHFTSADYISIDTAVDIILS
jgi:short-subunit dehydrogenase